MTLTQQFQFVVIFSTSQFSTLNLYDSTIMSWLVVVKVGNEMRWNDREYNGLNRYLMKWSDRVDRWHIQDQRDSSQSYG